MSEIISYRSQNRLPEIDELSLVLQNYWCSLPENIGKCNPQKLKRGWMQVFRGGIAVVHNLFYGEDNMVPQETAEKRAAICVICPKNVFPDKGPFLKYCDKIADASTFGRTTSLDEKLGNCAACSCVLKAKVHFGGKFKLTSEELSEMPDFCWQKAIVEGRTE